MFIYLYFTVEIFIMKLGSVPHLMFQILRDIGPVCVTLNALSPSLTDFPTLYVYANIFIINSNTLHFHILIDCYQQHIRWDTNLILTGIRKPSQNVCIVR